MNKRMILWVLVGWALAALVGPRDVLARFTK
jgi:hypothetical protein